MASERAAAAKTSANCNSIDSTLALRGAEVEGLEDRTMTPGATGAGITKQSGCTRHLTAMARINPIRRICLNWPITELGWPGLSCCHPTLPISRRAIISAGTMGAISVKRADKKPSTLGSERIPGMTKTAQINETAESSSTSGAVRNSEVGTKCLAASNAAAKAGLGPWLLFRKVLPLRNRAIPFAACNRMHSRLAKEKAHSRAIKENAACEPAEETPDKEDSDMEEIENRSIEKELLRNNRNWSKYTSFF